MSWIVAVRFMRVSLLLLLCGFAMRTEVLGAEINSSVTPSSVAEGKKTKLGLYLSSADAAKALDADPSILFLDVRDPVEVNFVGHPTAIDGIVPFSIVKHEFEPAKGSYKASPNSDFVKQAGKVLAREGLGKTNTVFVMCRSGDRSAKAADALADAGYTNVWSLVEGFEGDKDKDGKRTVNGWRNAGLPWKYELTATHSWVPSQ